VSRSCQVHSSLTPAQDASIRQASAGAAGLKSSSRLFLYKPMAMILDGSESRGFLRFTDKSVQLIVQREERRAAPRDMDASQSAKPPGTR